MSIKAMVHYLDSPLKWEVDVAKSVPALQCDICGRLMWEREHPDSIEDDVIAGLPSFDVEAYKAHLRRCNRPRLGPQPTLENWREFDWLAEYLSEE